MTACIVNGFFEDLCSGLNLFIHFKIYTFVGKPRRFPVSSKTYKNITLNGDVFQRSIINSKTPMEI